MRDDISEDRHGTYLGYGDGCDCPLCKEAWSDYKRERRRLQQETEGVVMAFGWGKLDKMARTDPEAMNSMYYLVEKYGSSHAKSRLKQFAKSWGWRDRAKRIEASILPREYTLDLNVRGFIKTGGVDMLRAVVERYGDSFELELLDRIERDFG